MEAFDRFGKGVADMRLIGAVSLIYVIVTGFALSGSAAEENAQAAVKQDEAKRREGQEIFRYDTFGDEQLWTDVLQMHEVIPSVDPATALAVGLKVDVDALPAPVIAALRAGQVDLTNPAVTVELIRLNAGGALAAFSVGSVFRNAYRGLLYLDALGAALFAVTAANKVLLPGLSGAGGRDDGRADRHWWRIDSRRAGRAANTADVA